MAQEMTSAETRNVKNRESRIPEQSRPIYTPDVDIYETGDHVVVIADLPGVAPEDVEVTLERQVLTIRGRTTARIPEGYSPVYSEYRMGDFERSFTLSEDVDRDNIKATHKDGVLTLELPKAETTKSRKIDISAA